MVKETRSPSAAPWTDACTPDESEKPYIVRNRYELTSQAVSSGRQREIRRITNGHSQCRIFSGYDAYSTCVTLSRVDETLTLVLPDIVKLLVRKSMSPPKPAPSDSEVNSASFNVIDGQGIDCYNPTLPVSERA